MAKTIKISDLTLQRQQMETMKTELEQAIDLIVKSIESMRNAGVESLSPIATVKLKELLSTAKTQKENLETGISILDECLREMKSVDEMLRKAINSGNVSGNVGTIKPICDRTTPSNQEVENHVIPIPNLTSEYYARFYRNPDPNQGGGQCTGYTKGRIYELLGKDYLADVWNWGGDFTLGAAQMGKGDFISVEQAINGEIMNLNCPAVCSNTGHVLVIENVVNVNGNITISYSEANSGWAPDGTIQNLSWGEFRNRYFSGGMGDYPAGFLRIKR